MQRLDRLQADLVRFADLCRVRSNEAAIRRVLEAYPSYFAESAVEFRTTTKALEKRDVSFRYVELDRPHDPYALAVEKGLLGSATRPVDRLVPELGSAFEIQGWGVDASVQAGLEKIWPFFAKQYPMNRLHELKSLPSAVNEHRGYFEKHRLRHVGIVAADYRHETSNLYFMVTKPGTVTPEGVAAMIQDAGFKAPAAEELAYDAMTVAINLTFSYASARIERLCFYVPAPTIEHVPADVRETLGTAVDDAPVIAPQRAYIIGRTYTPNGSYTKLEVDWTGTILGALQRCLGVPVVD